MMIGGILSFLLNKYKIVFFIVLFLSFLSFLLYFNHLRMSNAKMKEEIKKLSVELAECQKINSQLIGEIKLNEEKYQQKIKNLLKIANKPLKVIEIPKIIEKPVEITNEDCQKMGKMIDEFYKVEKDEEKDKSN